MKKSAVFLLGGHDLEMQEIARLLDEQGILYFDRNLYWENADVSAYLPELAQYGNLPGVCLYGVELYGKTDTKKYANYVLIDHHNENQGRAASILQVAEVLGVTPSRDQLLVAANDAGYIPGMQAIGATAEEIADIRRRDRAAQGVTEADEQAARKAITENRKEQDDLIIVRALSSRFSPICDRLWPYRKLLIYTDETLCYYGEGKDKLTVALSPEYPLASFYHGGGNNGFLGTVKGKWDFEGIRKLKAYIQSII